jgi:hypothetical protein
MQDLWYARSASQGVTLPEDAVRQETNRAKNERQQAQRQRRRLQSAVRAVARAQGGGGTPSEPESSGDDDDEEDEDEEEGEITSSPPNLPPPKDLPSLGNLFSQQAEISVGAHRAKHPWARTVSYPVLRNRERSLHTCAQDVQITRMATI